jgi:hypothetical protein
MKIQEILENEGSNQATRRPAVLNRAKQLLAASVLAAVAFAATLSAHALPIENGGFETGDLDGWTADSPWSDVGVTSDETYAGNYSLYLGPEASVYQQITTLKRFVTLRFKANGWITAGCSAYAVVEYYDGSSSEGEFSDSLAPAWQTFELDLDSSKRIRRVWFENRDGGTLIYIDNVALLD